MQLSKKVFKMDKLASGIVPEGDNRCRFDYKDLEKELKTIVAGKLQDEEASMEDPNVTLCPTFVVAIAGLHAEGPPSIFRSYKCHGASVSKCAIWQAGRATSAAPLLFKAMHIPTPTPGRTFIDGGFAYNNPSELAIKEARRIWPTHQRFCVTSIGTGYQRSISFIDTGSTSMGSKTLNRMNTWAGSRTADKMELGAHKVQKILEACAKLTQSSDAVHERMLGTAHWYHRFNVERGMESIDLQEWQKFDEMHGHAQNYLETGEGEGKRNCCVEDLLKVEQANDSNSGQSFIPEMETPSNNKSNRPVVSEFAPEQLVPPDTERSAAKTRSPGCNVTPEFVKPVPVKEELNDDTDWDSDDEMDHLGISIYPKDDWISENELSPQANRSFFDEFSSQEDMGSSSEKPAFRPYSPWIEEEAEEIDEENEYENETVSTKPVIPKVTAVEKPLSLVAYEFAEAVDRTYYQQGGDTEFIPSALDILKQLVGNRRANLETHHLYARLLWAARRLDDSCEQYETVMELDPVNERRTPAMYVQNYICDDCRRGGGEDGGISGHRYKCTSCRDYDLCNECFPPTSTSHPPGHKFLQIPSNRWLRANGLVCLSLTPTDC
jgi:hypothetical protein